MKIEDSINCKTKSCIYVLESDKDPGHKQYAGQNGGTMGKSRRIALQHANDIENINRIEKAVPAHSKETN